MPSKSRCNKTAEAFCDSQRTARIAITMYTMARSLDLTLRAQASAARVRVANDELAKNMSRTSSVSTQHTLGKSSRRFKR